MSSLKRHYNICNIKNNIIEKFIKIHGNKYDYSLVNYKSSKEKVIIICHKHGEFLQKPSLHLFGHGCAKCAGNNKLTTDSFIERSNIVHNNLYDYSKSEIKNSITPVIIICKKHGEFLQIPTVHYIKKSGCPNCKISKGEEKIKSILENLCI